MQTSASFERRLSSGIPVLFADLPGRAAALYWWVSVGSEKEGRGEEGFAHFLEHMLFKDAAAKETGAESTGKLARVIEGLGGDINAYTSLERTVYHVTCSEKYFEDVVEEFARMATPTEFLKSDFEREREVILEEYRRGEDNPSRALYETVFEQVFGPHPYGRPVIGFPKTLKAAKVQKLEAFYRREYQPSQMGFVVVGPMDPPRVSRILRSLEKSVGAKVWSRSSSVREFPAPIAPKLNTDPKFRKFDVQSPSMVLAWPAPGFLSLDAIAIELIVGALGQGDLSRLHQRLFLEKGLVTEIGAGLFNTRDTGMTYVSASADSSQKLTEIVREIDATIGRIQSEGVTAAEQERNIVAAESEKAYALQTVDGCASRLGFLRFVANDLELDRRSIQMLKGFRPEDAAGFATRYLGPERSFVALLPNADDLESLKASLRTSVQLALPMADPSQPLTSLSTRHEPRLITLGSGMRVVFQTRGSSPLFSLHVSCLGGVRLEGSLEGGSHLLGELWDKGTETHSHHQLLKEFEGRAASLSGYSGRNSIGIEATGLARDFGPLSEILTSVLTQPSLPDKELADVKRVTLDQLKTLDDHSSQLCSKLFMETLFETHPYGRYPLGSLASVQSSRREDLMGLYQRWVRPERLVISVSGGLSEKEVFNWAESLDRALNAASPEARDEARDSKSSLHDEVLRAPRWVERKMGREQVHCLYGTLGTTLSDPGRFALRILNNVLGGMGGRLFVELREKRSLAYSVHGNSMEGLERGYYSVYLASAPAKTEEAKVGIHRVLQAISKRPPTASEVKRAKEYSLGRRAMDLQSDSAIASHLGLQVLYRNELNDADETEALQKVTPAQVQKAAARLLEQPWVTAEVG